MTRPRAALSKKLLVEKAYLVFLIWQGEACLVALHRARGESDSSRRNSDVTGRSSFVHNQQAFSDFQSALTFAGNISKMLWPRNLRNSERKAALSRGRRLRQVLGIKRRDKVLFTSPTIRNNFEHLDARVDVWAQSTPGISIGLHALASDKALTGVAIGDRFTRYNPDADVFYMLGDRISLKRLEAKVTRAWRASVAAYRRIQRLESRLATQGEST